MATVSLPPRRPRTRVFADAELTAALRAAARAAGEPLTQSAYALHAVPDGRRPAPAPSTIARRFGGWSRALAAAGLDPHLAPRGRPRPSTQAVRATAVTHLRVAARSLGHGTGLSRSEYAEYRTFAADAPPLAVVERAFGSWPGALAAAGLVRSGPRSRRFSDADLLDGLRDAAAHTAGPLSLAAYERYRSEGALVELGSAQTAIARFGSWRAALTLAGLHTPRPPAVEAEAIATALRAFATAGEGTSCAAYRQWRSEIAPEAPGHRQALREHGTWTRALTAAGVDASALGRARLCRCLRRAAARAGGRLTVTAYQRLAAQDRALPSYRSYYREFGSWAAALREADLSYKLR